MDKRHHAAVMVQYPVRDAARCQILLLHRVDHAGLWRVGHSLGLQLLRGRMLRSLSSAQVVWQTQAEGCAK